MWAQYATTVASIAGKLLGKKKPPMIVYGRFHPVVDKNAYNADPIYRQAVDLNYAAHAKMFPTSPGWTSTSNANELQRGIESSYQALKAAQIPIAPPVAVQIGVTKHQRLVDYFLRLLSGR
jgi:hypothetical protein